MGVQCDGVYTELDEDTRLAGVDATLMHKKCGEVREVVGLLLQYEGQRMVPAASAQPIYAAAPVLSAVWALLVLREPITANEAVGGLGLGLAAFLARERGDAAGAAQGGGASGKRM